MYIDICALVKCRHRGPADINPMTPPSALGILSRHVCRVVNALRWLQTPFGECSVLDCESAILKGLRGPSRP